MDYKKLQQFRAKPDDDKIPINNAEQGVYRKEWNRLFIDHKTLWRRGEDKIGNQVTQFVVPNHQRPEIMDRMHSNVLSGHLMFDKTIARIKNRFFWPFMSSQIQKFISSCEPCQLATHPHRTQRAPLQPIQLQVNRTLEFVTTDYIGPLKRTKRGNTSIVVIVDHKTKYGWIRATKTQEANHLAPILIKIQTEFGFFEMLHSD